MRRLALAVVPMVVPTVVLLAGCGGGAGGSSSSDAATAAASGASSGAASPSASATPAATFNPCDSLSAAKISAALGAKVTISRGTATTPRCALLPVKKGGPTFDMSYLFFDGGLDAAWKTLSDKPAGTVTEPTVPGADAAKLVVQRKKSGYVVSAFLQNGSLIQSLNGVALPPYDVKAMARATTEILAELSAGAPAS
ncbi:DUF3558 family protein [Nocardioides sp. BP30]|uniref:DUF3558 family protein n=1 Tax=Nocardioides sp. BP30 TaxID=3036374 RepID=UPI0024693909|nr:DUF3558 family protein [Nocardioides sp. BP30]WGL52734.1 DUF3558 family protein [Nocardioides sp. BP30]